MLKAQGQIHSILKICHMMNKEQQSLIEKFKFQWIHSLLFNFFKTFSEKSFIIFNLYIFTFACFVIRWES